MALLFLGLFLWGMAVLLDFVFSVPQTTRKGLHDIWQSISIDFETQNGIEFGLSLAKLTGLIWIGTFIVINYVLKVELSTFVVALIFLAPVWIGAFIWERKNT